jgi:protoheme IX farnesyltransferase
MSKVRSYYMLTKPGIVRGNALWAAAGFVLASTTSLDLPRFIAMLVGLSLVVAAACVFNNYVDRDIDRLMDRTKHRALAKGTVTPRHASNFGVALLWAGALILGFFTNLLTLALALFGLIMYALVYTVAKRHTVHGTIIGSISGAIPPVVGYAAVTGRIDLAALILFAILVFWQMPHFYAIAIYRLSDYQAAHIPVLPAVQGIPATKHQMIAYIAGFIAMTLWLFAAGYTGVVYAVIMAILGLVWLGSGIAGLRTTDDERWARGMFRLSLIVTSAFLVLIVLDKFLP